MFYYQDKDGQKPVEEYIRKLTSKADKDSRIKANKILDYINYLRATGPQAREPYAKHLDGDIWNCARYAIEFYMPHGTAKASSY